MSDAKPTRPDVEDLNQMTLKILSDRKQSNLIVDLVKLLEVEASSEVGDDSQSESYLKTLIQCLSKILVNGLLLREMVLYANDKQTEKINTYKRWLIKLYDTVIDYFIKILSNDKFSLDIRKLVLLSLVEFMEKEGKFPFRAVASEESLSFPVDLQVKILRTLVSASTYNQELINTYCTYYQYDDFIHFTLVSLHKILDEMKGRKDVSIVVINVIDLLFPIRLITPSDLLPKSLQAEVKVKKRKRKKGVTGEHNTFARLCELEPYSETGRVTLPKKKFKFDYERDATLYSTLWLKYLNFDLPPATFKRALLYLDKYALQHFANPLLLADFLINSFQSGGIISLLSLSPLYTLMHKCNLEYPHFFHTLYELIEPAITYVHYRARFLFWCDLFLTSTHIPAQIVASFAKKLARLALTTTPDATLIILPFIGNLLIRHPMIQSMLVYKEMDAEKDTFDPSETDPEATRAIKSYLWELKVLQSHYHPEVVALATEISTALPKLEWNLEDTLETRLDDVISKTRDSLQKVDRLTYDINCELYYLL